MKALILLRVMYLALGLGLGGLTGYVFGFEKAAKISGGHWYSHYAACYAGTVYKDMNKCENVATSIMEILNDTK